jgi:hypothetical protein
MTAARTASALVVALAAFAAASAPGRALRVALSSFPGPPQPDPGTDAAPSRSGRVVAFASSMRANGARFDPAATPTVFLWDRRLGTLRQVTVPGPSDQPSAENGTAFVAVGTATQKTVLSRTLVAFRSTADLAGGNADGSAEIFVWDSLNGGITQITSAAAGASSDPAIGAHFWAERDANDHYTGNELVRYRVAFLSTSDLTGDNPDGLKQVFLYDSGLPPVERLVQVSHSTAGPAYPPVVDGTGDRVAFLHDEQVMPGYVEPAAFVWDRAGGLRGPGPQGGLHVVPGANVTGAELSIDTTGRWLALKQSYVDPATMNVLGDMVQLVEVRTGRTKDFVPTAGSHRSPTLGKGPRRLACLSTDPGDGGSPVAERPVLLDGRARIRDAGLPGGPYGSPLLQRDGRVLFLTSTQDLDGSNASGRDVLFLLRLRP